MFRFKKLRIFLSLLRLRMTEPITRRILTKKAEKAILSQLMERKDEVIKRAISVANRTLPDYLVDMSMADILEWIITPHIHAKYEPYIITKDAQERGALRAVHSILKQIKDEDVDT